MNIDNEACGLTLNLTYKIQVNILHELKKRIFHKKDKAQFNQMRKRVKAANCLALKFLTSTSTARLAIGLFILYREFPRLPPM